jgi:3-oxoacyl-[acyl-carrier protein] reductase
MNVLLTGASRGIGYETALSLCKSGVKHLILVSRNKNALEKLKEDCLKISPSKVEITLIPEDITEIVSHSYKFLENLPVSVLDIVINNAGLLINKTFQEFTIDEGKELMDVNFHAPAQLIKILQPLLNESSMAHVVNISSIGGWQGSSKYPGLSYYSASKAALAVLTECLAVEYSDSAIHFNCLAIGAVQTEMLEQAFPGFIAPVSAKDMGAYIANFALTAHKYFNGQIIPVRLGNP